MLDCNGTHDDINQGDDKIHPGHGALGQHVRLQAGDSRAVSLYEGEEQVTEHVQGVPKKMSFLGKIAITTLKLIQNIKVGGVLENSGYLLPDGH